MTRGKTTSIRHFPVITLVTILLITLALFLGLGWQTLRSYKDIKAIQEREFRLQKLVGIIIYLDEVLTMSARMGVATGNLRWEERYLDFKPKLDAIIKETERLVPETFMSEAASQTYNANIKLVTMETQAFELVRQSNKEDALALLLGEEYEEQKKNYADGMKQITFSIQSHIKDILKEYLHRAYNTFIAISIALPSLIIAWIYVFRVMRNYIINRGFADTQIRKLSHAIEHSSATVIITDTKGKIEYINPKFLQLTGYTIEEAIGQNLRILKFESTLPEVYEELWKTIKSGRDWHGEICNKKKNGEIYWENVIISPVKNPKGVITNFIAVEEDISERKQTEERISCINTLKEYLLDHSGLEEKLMRITNDVVKIFNADFCRIWLIKPGDLCETGCIHAEVTEGPHICRFRERCLHLMASSGRYSHIDGDHRRVPFGCYKIGLLAGGIHPKLLTNDVMRDKRIHDHDWAGNLGLVSFAGYKLLSSDAIPIGILALFSKQMIFREDEILIDGIASTTSQVIQTSGAEDELIKHQKHLESLVDLRTKELRVSQEKLIETERMAVLGKLSGSIAHEIRNPLATIDISALNLKKNLKDADEKSLSQINRIINQVKEATETIQSLQDLSNLEIPNKKRRDICYIIEEGIDVSRIPLSVKTIRKVAKGEFFVDIDEKQISIVFRNILSNAIHAMGNKGTILVTACKDREGNVNVSIKDSGHGIAPDNIKKIFQSFFGTKPKGFGYGLTLCRTIMEKHGGTISVQPEEEKGTTFTLSFPLVSDISIGR